jgi:predicted DNA-binding transcriptional regulator AlpA
MDDLQMMYTISEFCTAHRISRSLFYQLLRQGRGPRITRIGARVLIARLAADEWRQRIAQESTGHGEDQGPPG